MTGSGPEPVTTTPHPAPPAGPLVHDALVLAGGRARRLGGVSKPDVVVAGRRLLAHVLDAARAGTVDGPRRTVVVAPEAVVVPDGVLRTLEDPPDGGPVAGIAAGLAVLGGPRAADAVPGAPDVPGADRALAGPASPDGGPGDVHDGDPPAPWVLVLACDVPRAAGAVPRLVAACTAADPTSGALLVDAEGRDQPLVGLYRRADLDRALGDLGAGRGPDGVRGASVRALLARLSLTRVPDKPGDGTDVDTWDDVRALDAAAPHVPGGPGAGATPSTPRAGASGWDDGDGPGDRVAADAPAPPAPAPPEAAPPAPAPPEPRRFR